jgi:hypothetical protein
LSHVTHCSPVPPNNKKFGTVKTGFLTAAIAS